MNEDSIISKATDGLKPKLYFEMIFWKDNDEAVVIELFCKFLSMCDAFKFERMSSISILMQGNTPDYNNGLGVYVCKECWETYHHTPHN